MEKRVDAGEGRIIREHVDDEAVADAYDERPPIESDPDELDEGATEAMILVNPRPNNMTVEGAVAAVGVTARYLFGAGDGSPTQGTWWHDWGKYVAILVVMMVAVTGFRLL